MAAVSIPDFATIQLSTVFAVTSDVQAQYEDFFVNNYSATVGLLMSMGITQEQAQDASQDAFVKLYTRWSRLRRHDSPEAWVRRVAINRARDLHRSDARRTRREERVGEPTTSPGADQGIGDADSTRRLLLQLPRRQRTIAALFYIDDMPVKEIADSLGLSSGAVKFHLNRARKSLKAVLGDDISEDPGDQ